MHHGRWRHQQRFRLVIKNQQEEFIMPEIIFNKNISEFWTPERCFIQEILNDPSHPNSSLAVARVPPGVTTQLHRLNGTEETYIIKRGDGVLEIDGEKSELQLGDAIIIPAGASQKISNIGDEDLEFFCLCTPRFLPECYEDLED